MEGEAPLTSCPPIEIANTLGNLELSTSHPQKTAQKPKSKPVADSWEAELSGSDTETEDVDSGKSEAKGSPHDSLQPLSTSTSRDIPPNPPPPGVSMMKLHMFWTRKVLTVPGTKTYWHDATPRKTFKALFLPTVVNTLAWEATIGLPITLAYALGVVGTGGGPAAAQAPDDPGPVDVLQALPS